MAVFLDYKPTDTLSASGFMAGLRCMSGSLSRQWQWRVNYLLEFKL